MSYITVEAPEHIAKKFKWQKIVSYKQILEEYEQWFEYEKVNMEAWEFHDFLAKELQYD